MRREVILTLAPRGPRRRRRRGVLRRHRHENTQGRGWQYRAALRLAGGERDRRGGGSRPAAESHRGRFQRHSDQSRLARAAGRGQQRDHRVPDRGVDGRGHHMVGSGAEYRAHHDQLPAYGPLAEHDPPLQGLRDQLLRYGAGLERRERDDGDSGSGRARATDGPGPGHVGHRSRLDGAAIQHRGPDHRLPDRVVAHRKQPLDGARGGHGVQGHRLHGQRSQPRDGSATTGSRQSTVRAGATGRASRTRPPALPNPARPGASRRLPAPWGEAASSSSPGRARTRTAEPRSRATASRRPRPGWRAGPWWPRPRARSPRYLHTRLAAGTTRYYRVAAVNSAGRSDWSDVVPGTTDPAPPGQPLSVRARAASATSITLDWQAPAVTGGAPVTDYSIQRRGPNDRHLDHHPPQYGFDGDDVHGHRSPAGDRLSVPGQGDQLGGPPARGRSRRRRPPTRTCPPRRST